LIACCATMLIKTIKPGDEEIVLVSGGH
jgi:hypothetical protein